MRRPWLAPGLFGRPARNSVNEEPRPIMNQDEQSPPEEPPASCGDAIAGSPWSIEVGNFQSTQSAPIESLRAAVEQVLSTVELESARISVAVVDDSTIHELNRTHLQHDYATDVLSYPLSDDENCLEGEIVVSAETAARNAADAGWSAADELLLYVVHGTLHLVGYADKTPADAAEMRNAEAAILAQLGVACSPIDTRWSDLNPSPVAGEPTSP